MQSQIIITINLPQPVSKIAPFLIAMDDSWPGMVMQAHNPTAEFDEQLDADPDGRDRYTFDRFDGREMQEGGDVIQITDEAIGGTITIPRRQLAAFIAAVNGVGEGPVMLDVDGAATIDIEAS